MNIRQVERVDVAALAEMEASIWGEGAANADRIALRSEVFPEGSVIAELQPGMIAGYVVVQRVTHVSTSSWEIQTDGGTLARTHRPDGRLLYGVNLSVTSQGARHGVSKALIEHCYATFVGSGQCEAICLGSRLPGFSRWADRNGRDIRAYLAPDEQGRPRDPELRIYHRNGFRTLWALQDYFDDPDSLNFGAMILRS